MTTTTKKLQPVGQLFSLALTQLEVPGINVCFMAVTVETKCVCGPSSPALCAFFFYTE